MSANKQVVIYKRVSTEYQVRGGLSLESQEQLCVKFATMHGYTVKAIVSDEGKSGTTTKNRAGLEEALNMLDKQTYLLVYSLSRLSRSVDDALELCKRIDAKGSKLMAFTEGFNGIDEDDRFTKVLHFLLGEKESSITGRRVSNTMKMRKEKVGISNNSAHYGWKYDSKVKGDDGRLILQRVKSEQEVIQRIIAMDEEMSANKIAETLNAEQVPTRMNGKKWHSKTVLSIIRYQEENQGSEIHSAPYVKE